MSNDNLDFENIDALLGASMDDLDDLPPQGVPPSGHYNLTMTTSIEDFEKDGEIRKMIVASYVVDAINELKDETEADEVAVGQQFRETFFLLKKDGTKNVFGIGTLKERLKPLAERFGTSNIGDLINQTKQVAITATIKRKASKKDADQYNMQMKDMVLL